ALEKLSPVRLDRPDYKLRGVHLDAVLPADKVVDFARALLGLGFLLEDVTAVDASPELMVVYHFAHPDELCRVVGRVLTDRESPQVPSIQAVYQGANWHEREAHDFYGVVFEGHPDLSPLILPEDSGDLRPLRKAEGELKALGAVMPEFAPPKAEGEAAEAAEKPVRPKREKPAPTEGEA
ncbi:MAG: NADH-quinone oxidoreductase subunit C, partial [Deltaproteobacteria bacterium]|nr:NADH-quinone oxidoreductase subunit C [Deltaproteobacteria bacterium]